MQFIIEDPTTLDPASLSNDLIATLGSNYGISTAGTIITTNGEEPDPVAFQAVLDAHAANANKRTKAANVDALYQQNFYSNTTALFPSGAKVIQLRDENDFRSFERVVLAAVTRQAARREAALVEFRTEDNVTQTLPASEFIPVALDILDAKQAIWKVKTAHKDALAALSAEEAAGYDETADWPAGSEAAWVTEERASKIYKAMIRRRAGVLSGEGKNIEALALLKTIGE